MRKQWVIKIIFFPMICLSNPLFAKAIMMVAPSTPGTITLSQTATLLINYVVTNNTNNQTLNSFTITPAYGVSQNAKFAISLFNNNCTGNLIPGASCTFQIQLTGNVNLPENFVLSPRVCAYNNAVCSQPEASMRSVVNVVATTSGCSANGYGTGCYVMVSKNQVDGTIAVLAPAPSDAPDVSVCNALTDVAKADCICSSEGPAANHGNGTWRAWLGISTANPRVRLNNLLGHPAFPLNSAWVSLETGKDVYSNWGALGDNIITYPDISPSDHYISSSNTDIFTGSFPPNQASVYSCSDWTSTVYPFGADQGVANQLKAYDNFTNTSWNSNAAFQLACNTYHSVYCTEVSP